MADGQDGGLLSRTDKHLEKLHPALWGCSKQGRRGGPLCNIRSRQTEVAAKAGEATRQARKSMVLGGEMVFFFLIK